MTVSINLFVFKHLMVDQINYLGSSTRINKDKTDQRGLKW